MELQYFNSQRKVDMRFDHINYKNNKNSNYQLSGISTINNKYLTLDPTIIATNRQRRYPYGHNPQCTTLSHYSRNALRKVQPTTLPKAWPLFEYNGALATHRDNSTTTTTTNDRKMHLPPSYAEAIMRRLSVSGGCGVSASSIAGTTKAMHRRSIGGETLVEECAEIFLTPTVTAKQPSMSELDHSLFNNSDRHLPTTSPAYLTSSSTSASSLTHPNYGDSTTTTFPITIIHLRDNNNNTDGNVVTIRQQQQQQNARRLSLVEALRNNSLYYVCDADEDAIWNQVQRGGTTTSTTINKDDKYDSAATCQNKNQNFRTHLSVSQSQDEMLRIRATEYQNNSTNNNNDESCCYQHYKQQHSDNNNASNAKLPAKFPVNEVESEMVRKRPAAPFKRIGAPSQQKHPHYKQQSDPMTSQQQRERRSRSQPLSHQQQQHASLLEVLPPEMHLLHSGCIIGKGILPSNCCAIDYDNFAVDHAAHVECNALPSTSSMEFNSESGNNTAAVQQQCRRRIELMRDARSQRHHHVSRADRFSIDSEAGNSSQDSGIRSSTHSNSSTITSNSNNGEQLRNYATEDDRSSASGCPPPQVPPPLLVVEAVWDHVAMLADELPFVAGDIITVLDRTGTIAQPMNNSGATTASTGSGLWYGICKDSCGWFPVSYVKVRSDDMSLLATKPVTNKLNKKPNNNKENQISADNVGKKIHAASPAASEEMAEDAAAQENAFPQQMRYLRRKIAEELLVTERDYVKLLHNLVKGFVEQCRRRTELFSEERVARIFGNIEQIHSLHVRLLHDLEANFDAESPETSCLAGAFLKHSQHFGVYTEYCNNRPVSCSELAQLQRAPQFFHFFEACRLLHGMAKLSLEGFLLTPVQRICRYPLQLFELLKATPAAHRDRAALEQAHRTMRAVAAHINDAKRRVDAIQKIVLWQRNVHGFRGPDLIDNNHRMLISGEVYCRALMRNNNNSNAVSNASSNTASTTSLQWSKTVHAYLFDQSIILCKKDVLKKHCLVFKERMSLQNSCVNDLHDGKEPITGVNLRNSFKLIGVGREYIFTCPDPATKGLWLDALRNRPRPTPPTSTEKRLALITLNCGGT